MSVNIFARWSSEEECLQEMLGLHDEESARAIVAGINQRVSSGTLFKSLEGEMRVISKAGDDELVVHGPCSWEKVDPENDLITAGAMSKFFKKWFSVVPERYRNVMLMHKSFQAGVPLLKYQGSDGQMYYTHVHEKGAMLVSKIRDDDGLAQTKDLRQKVHDGVYKSYSIGGVPVDTEKEMQGDRLVTIIKDIDPGEVTICPTGMNDMAKFEVVKSGDMTDAQREILSYIPHFTSNDIINMTKEEWLAFLEKPFAGFKDFAACVKSVSARKKPPKDPKAYCAAIQAKVEGAKKAMLEAFKGMTLDQINAKIASLRTVLNANRKKIRDYWDAHETPEWVRDLEEENIALWDELSAWREARVERIVGDAKKINIALKSMTLDQINAKITTLRNTLNANRKKIREYWDSRETPEWISVLHDENSALRDELSAWREARVERIVEDAKAPPKKEKKADIHKIIQDALQPLSKSIEALEARTRKKIESGEDKPKSHEEVSKAMDERTLETALKVREIFKELEKIG